MTTTLSEGVKVPDVGSVNWAGDLEVNWNLLNGALANLSGNVKTDRDNTWTGEQSFTLPIVGSITGTASKAIADEDGTSIKTGYGKLAGDQTWSGLNVFSNTIESTNGRIYRDATTLTKGTLPSATTYYGVTNDYALNSSSASNRINQQRCWVETDGKNVMEWNLTAWNTTNLATLRLSISADGTNKNFVVDANLYCTTGAYTLGTSTNRWKSVYADSYYYGTTAWGLDKENVWTQNQIISSSNDRCYFIKDTVYELGQNYPNGEHLGGLQIQDKNGSIVGMLDIVDRNFGNMEMRIRVQQRFDPDSNNRSTSGNILFNEMILGITPTKTNYIGFNADLWGANHNLGVATSKWSTINGINPGALSLPNVNAVTGSSNTQLQDISGDLVQDQYLNCYFTPRMDGWAYIALNCSNATIRSGHSSFSVMAKTAGVFANALYTQSFTKTESAWSNLVILFPVTANKEITLECTFTGFSVTKGYVIPCLGNV